MIRKAEARDDFDDFEEARTKVYAYQDALLEYLRQYGRCSTTTRSRRSRRSISSTSRSSASRTSADGRPGARADVRQPAHADQPDSWQRARHHQPVRVDREEHLRDRRLRREEPRHAGAHRTGVAVRRLREVAGEGRTGRSPAVLVGQALDLLDPDARELLEAAGINIDKLVTVFSPRLDPKASERMVTVIRNGKAAGLADPRPGALRRRRRDGAAIDERGHGVRRASSRACCAPARRSRRASWPATRSRDTLVALHPEPPRVHPGRRHAARHRQPREERRGREAVLDERCRAGGAHRRRCGPHARATGARAR